MCVFLGWLGTVILGGLVGFRRRDSLLAYWFAGRFVFLTPYQTWWLAGPVLSRKGPVVGPEQVCWAA